MRLPSVEAGWEAVRARLGWPGTVLRVGADGDDRDVVRPVHGQHPGQQRVAELLQGRPPEVPQRLLHRGQAGVQVGVPALDQAVGDQQQRGAVAELDDGDTLLLVTDGLVERRDADLDAGLAALREALRDLGETPLEELCDTLLARMLPEPGADDVAIVAVRAHPEDRPRPPEAGPNRLPPGID